MVGREISLPFLPMSTPALYNIKTVTGLQDCLVLQVIDSLGNVISGDNYVVRGAIALKGETYNLTVTQDALGDYLLTWENLPAGVWRYDIFVNEEPLLYGNAIVQGRVTPCVTENTQDLGQFLQVQTDQEGAVKITLSDVNSAKWYAEVAKGSADEAKNVLQDTENLSLNIERQIEAGKTEISDTTASSISSINTAENRAIANIDTEKENALDDLSQEVVKAQNYATSAHYSATQSATSATNAQESEVEAKNAQTATETLADELNEQYARAVFADNSGNVDIEGGLTVDGTVNLNVGAVVPDARQYNLALSYNGWNILHTRDILAPFFSNDHRMSNLFYSNPFLGNGDWTTITSGTIRNCSLRLSSTMNANNGNVNLLCSNNQAYSYFLGDHHSPYNYSQAVISFFELQGFKSNAPLSVFYGAPCGYSISNISTNKQYKHPIFWHPSSRANQMPNLRYPKNNSHNRNVTGVNVDPEERYALQLTLYPPVVLKTSIANLNLVRGTAFGEADPDYMWGFFVSLRCAVTSVQVKGSPYTSQWRLYTSTDYKHIMTCNCGYCGTGHTAAQAVVVRGENVKTASAVSVSFAQKNVISRQLENGISAMEVTEKALSFWDTEEPRPMPSLAYDNADIPATGGNVTVNVNSTNTSAIYVYPDTMCLDEPWASVDNETISGGSGQFTLTVNANETGEDREVWVFVGHANARVSIVKLLQKGA